MPIYLVFIALFSAGLGASYWLGFTPLLLPLALLLLSAITYGFYAKDKAAAVAGDWRVPENTLHLLALLGGWPGAIFGQQRLRHKTKKRSFRAVFYLTLVLNLAALAWLHSAPGQQSLRQSLASVQSLARQQLPASTLATVYYLTTLR
ncbi:DUF1294 domain-containing protein [Halioxenophilus sp. WMMB6]|uniref:DUF1294 domain-containing protein n=1 Tax=Halioxenophilus sp. WMMB6 TaxID=3073815 RepID=UPI00295E7C34|nr:DUF1294 domain-containing protein [Halioxenophilus sp. WMMB6]